MALGVGEIDIGKVISVPDLSLAAASLTTVLSTCAGLERYWRDVSVLKS